MRILTGVLALAFFQDDPARLVEALRSGDLEQRENALRKLKDLGERALPELRKAANDPDQEVAGRARFLLRRAAVAAEIGDRLRQAVPGIEDRLAAGDSAWTQVWMDLSRRSEEELAPELLEPLAAPGVRHARSENEKNWVCRTAASRGYASAGVEIVRLLEDPSDRVKASALQALISLRSPDVVPVLLQRIREGSDEVRANAEQVFIMMAGALPPAKLVELLKADSPRLRAAGVRALVGLGQDVEEATPALVGALGDVDPAVREAALAGVAQLRKKEAAPKLAALLKDAAAGVRCEAARALAAVNARDRAADLRPLLTDADESVRQAAVAALASLGDAPSAGAMGALLRDPSEEVRHATAYALVDLGALESAAALRDLLKEGTDGSRLVAIWALGHLRAAEAVEDVEAFLVHPEAAFRFSAAAALGRLGGRGSLALLTRALGDKVGLVRAGAAQALGRLGPLAERGPLLEALSDASPVVRAEAARALARLEARESVPLLQNLLEDEGDVDDAEDGELERFERFEDCPELRTRFDRLQGPVRAAAAEGLVRMGFREGIAAAIAAADDDYESITLTGLNAFRRPEEVARLARTPLAADLTGSPLDRLREIARVAGLEPQLEDLDETDEMPPLPRLKADGSLTLWDALRDTADASGLDVIIDRRRLRIAEDLEIYDFWSSWWETEKDE